MPGDRKGRIIWVSATEPSSRDERKRIVTTALESGFVDILIREEDEEFKKLGKFDAFTLRGEKIFLDESLVGQVLTIKKADDLRKASELKDKIEFIVIKTLDWKIIPLENLIAEFQRSKTKLLASTSNPEEAKLFAETLEVGVSGIVIEPNSPKTLKEFRGAVSRELPPIKLTAVPVSRIVPLSLGDRVCVDTCSLLRVGEGMLVGSQSACLFLVHSESLESEYVASRPFRVNAGAVHAYILGPDGKTRYLSEVSSGDELLAVDISGNCRTVVVGRAKIERRPLILVEIDASGKKYTTILQNAETIRLCTPDGSVSVAELKEGQKVLVRLEEGGRHFGHAINETIVER
ncbi:MAG: 3-dehydroquinate synthase II [Methanomassiliicoccales archaeon]|jgi:3-dehydroquinate synthase II|nr:3-dehydroquinate synthase II [Methanomassiliicoccales archaeon]